MDELRVEGLDFFLQSFFFFPFFEELLGPLLESLHNVVFVFFYLFLLFLELHEFGFVDNDFVLFLQLCSQFQKLVFVLSDQRLLIEILVYDRLVLYAFCTVCEIQ